MKPVLLIIAPKDFRDEELFETQEEIEKGGFETNIASKHTGECVGVKGGIANSIISIEDIMPEAYSAVVFVGGAGSRVYFDDKKVHFIVNTFYKKNQPVAAICIAPVILVQAGLLKNKKATVYPTEIETIQDAGAIYTGEPVTQDGKIITGNGAEASRAFGRAIVMELNKK